MTQNRDKTFFGLESFIATGLTTVSRVENMHKIKELIQKSVGNLSTAELMLEMSEMLSL